MTELSKRYDFALLFDVQNGNPNGDPDAGNLPRIDPETGRGLVTDVCLKRKVRNYVALVNNYASPYDIYIKEKAVLGRAHVEAFKDLDIPLGEEKNEVIPSNILEEVTELSLPDGISIQNDEADDEKSVLVFEQSLDVKEAKGWLATIKKSKDISTDAHKFINSMLKGAKSRKPKSEETEKGRDWMCKKFYDIRTFGAVMTLSSAPNCGQVRGPVQMTFAQSVDPVVTLEHSITRMAVATEKEAEKQGGDNRTMGRKNTIPYGLYLGYGFVSPHLARQTHFSEEDLVLFWDALTSMFEHDRSAARGLMATRKLFIFEHESPMGNTPAHALFERIRIARNSPGTPARAFSDYTVTPSDELRAALPAGVTLIER